jgi:hypothetical protein
VSGHPGRESEELRMQMSDAAIALVTLITAAFGNSPRLPRKELVARGTWEARDLVRALAAVNDSPDRAFIERHFDSLPAFTPAGLRHVLPQYLIYSLEHPRSEATERIIFHLSPDDTESSYWRERLEAFSPAQKQAICEYIRFMQSELVGEYYDEYLTRALTVWGCG